MSVNRPTAPRDHSAAGRDTPRIWAEGQQRPRFDLRSYSRVSLLLSRRMARPLLLNSASILNGGAERIAENTLGPRFARAWRLARALPSRDAVARGLRAAADFMTVAADLAVPPPPKVEVPALPEPVKPLLISRRPRQAELRLADPQPAEPSPARRDPTPAIRPTDDPELDATTIAAIRAMIDEMRDARPARPPVAPRRPEPADLSPVSGRVLLTHAVPLTPPEPPTPTLAAALRASAVRLAAGLVAGGVTLLALPVGLVRALDSHLHGNDLRTWS